jgi:hypothetical protein
MPLWRVEGKLHVFTHTRNNKTLGLILEGKIKIIMALTAELKC